MNRKKYLSLELAGVLLASSTMAMAAVAADSPSAPAGDPARFSGSQRFLVKYRAGAPELRDAGMLNRGLDVALGRAQLSGAGVATTRSAARSAVSARLLRRTAVANWSVVSTSRLLDGAEQEGFLRELKIDPAVESVEVDRMYEHMGLEARVALPNDPSYAQQWNLSGPFGVRAPEAWAITQGEGVVVAVLDTGIVQGNPDLMNNALPGYDMITERRVSRRDSDERVAGGWDVGDWSEAGYCESWAPGDVVLPGNSSWHGSRVAGIVAQQTNNGLLLAGLAHKAKVLPVRVLGSCGGYTSDIADGIVWAAGGEVPGIPLNPNPAEVINLSLGSSKPRECPSLYQEAINKANSRGAIVVVAAGNRGGDASKYTLSSCTGVISVAATGARGEKAYYSNYGMRIDIAAPGGDGVTNNISMVTNTGRTRPEAGWRLMEGSGTSMAAPHVAAAVAMVQSVARTPLNLRQMRNLLRDGATQFPAAIPVSTPIGPGILNAHAALVQALAVCDPAQKLCPLESTQLFNKLVESIDGDAGSTRLFRYTAEAGKVLSFITLGGRGNVSLHVSQGKEPQVGQADAYSARLGNNETVRFNTPKAGTYYIKLVGESAYSDVALVARQ